MKYYLYYIVPDRMYKPTPSLYAFTADKKLAAEFEDTRNMKLFLKKEADIPDKRCKKFEMTFSERRLITGRFPTFSDKANVKGYIKKKTISLVCTVEEEESIVFDEEKYFEKLKDTLIDIGVLESKYIRCLHKIAYVDLYCFNNRAAEYNAFYEPYYTEMTSIKVGLSLITDQFKLFLKTHSMMFKIDKAEDDKERKR